MTRTILIRDARIVANGIGLIDRVRRYLEAVGLDMLDPIAAASTTGRFPHFHQNRRLSHGQNWAEQGGSE
jgi:hypothetical protein